jgi:hypothetical protein
VRGVGHEPLLGVERGRDPVQHGVERLRELGHLVVGARVPDPLVERLAGEPLRGRGHALQRAQRAPGHRVGPDHPDRAHQQEREAAADEQRAFLRAGQHAAGQQPEQAHEHGAGAGHQDAVEHGEPEAERLAQPPRPTRVVNRHETRIR